MAAERPMNAAELGAARTTIGALANEAIDAAVRSQGQKYTARLRRQSQQLAVIEEQALAENSPFSVAMSNWHRAATEAISSLHNLAEVARDSSDDEQVDEAIQMLVLPTLKTVVEQKRKVLEARLEIMQKLKKIINAVEHAVEGPPWWIDTDVVVVSFMNQAAMKVSTPILGDIEIYPQSVVQRIDAHPVVLRLSSEDDDREHTLKGTDWIEYIVTETINSNDTIRSLVEQANHLLDQCRRAEKRMRNDLIHREQEADTTAKTDANGAVQTLVQELSQLNMRQTNAVNQLIGAIKRVFDIDVELAVEVPDVEQDHAYAQFIQECQLPNPDRGVLVNLAVSLGYPYHRIENLDAESICKMILSDDRS